MKIRGKLAKSSYESKVSPKVAIVVMETLDVAQTVQSLVVQFLPILFDSVLSWLILLYVSYSFPWKKKTLSIFLLLFPAFDCISPYYVHLSLHFYPLQYNLSLTDPWQILHFPLYFVSF